MCVDFYERKCPQWAKEVDVLVLKVNNSNMIVG